jgi:hypothetical protein
VLHVVLPRANVLVAIRVYESALPTLVTLLKVACVNSVLLSHLSFTVKHVIFELTDVGSLRVSEKVGSLSWEAAINEHAIVVAAVRPLVATFAIFCAIYILTLEFYLTKLPSLFSKTVLAIIKPVAFTRTSLRIHKRSVPIR